jgi:hypothetical protein
MLPEGVGFRGVFFSLSELCGKIVQKLLIYTKKKMVATLAQ